MKRQNKTFSILRYLLLIYLGFTVFYPLICLFVHIRGSHIREIVGSGQFVPMLVNSLVTTVIATVLSVALAFLLAFLLNRSAVRFKSVWAVLFTVPMLIPSISHGMGLVLLFGDNGIISNLLHVNIGLYGYPGIIMGSILYSFPIAFLLFFDSFQYEDFTVYEISKVLGLSKTRQFMKITMPSMKRATISAVLSVFTMVFTDYGVPLMTGGTVMTLPVYMYREVIGMMNFSGGAVVGIVLLLPAVIAFLTDLKKSTATSGSTVTKPYQIEKNPLRDSFAYLILGISFLLLCLPIFAFIWLSFVKKYPIDMQFTWTHIENLLSRGIGMTFVNSIAVALATAFIGTVLSYFAAFVTARSKRRGMTKLLHFAGMFPLAVPGVVLGLSFVMAFHDFPLYGTIFILIIVNVVHFFSSPYLLAYNSLGKFNSNLEDVGKSLGISKMRMLADVYLPGTIPTVIEMYSYFFVNAMITISAVSFLSNFKTTTLSLMIPQLESQSFIEGTAIVSLLILILNLMEKGIAFFIKRKIK